MSRQQPDMKRRIAANICRVLDERQLSAAEVARQIGANEKTVRRWRDAEVTPSQSNLAELAMFLGVDLTSFYLPHDDEAVEAAA